MSGTTNGGCQQLLERKFSPEEDIERYDSSDNISEIVANRDAENTEPCKRKNSDKRQPRPG